jgi:hypothetical protein
LTCEELLESSIARLDSSTESAQQLISVIVLDAFEIRQTTRTGFMSDTSNETNGNVVLEQFMSSNDIESDDASRLEDDASATTLICVCIHIDTDRF